MRRMRRVVALVVLAVNAGMSAPELRAQAQPDRLRAALVNRIDEARRGTGVMVGLLTPDGRSFMTYGRVSAGGSEPTAETMFEIGSIIKVFTALLLADMVERGEVALDDPVLKYLPASVIVPSRGGRQISVADLATHTSGLPRTPANMDAGDLDNPYARYGSAELYAFLASYTLPRAEAAMGGDTPLKAAFARMTSVRRPHQNGSMQQASGAAPEW